MDENKLKNKFISTKYLNEEFSNKNKVVNSVFIGKDDGEEKRVAVFIEGKHGKIGIIRPNKKSTEKDKQEFLRTLAEIAIRGVNNEK